MKKTAFFTTRNIATLSVLSAASYGLYMFVKFPLPFFPSFLDVQISDVPALIAAFMMGTPAGIAVIIIKGLLKLPFTSTGGVGELADVVIGICFVTVSSVIYNRKKTKKTAVVSLASGSLTATFIAVIMNRFVLIPFYVMLFGGWDPILNMVRGLYPSVTQESFYSFYLWLAVVPFNILRAALVSLVTYLVYKALSRVYKTGFDTGKKKLPLTSPAGDKIDNP